MLGFSELRGQDVGSRAPPPFFEVQIRVRRWTVRVATETVLRAGPAARGGACTRFGETESPATAIHSAIKESLLCPHCVPPTVLEAARLTKGTLPSPSLTPQAGWPCEGGEKMLTVDVYHPFRNKSVQS